MGAHTMTGRFRDPGKGIYNFRDRYLLHCPRCDRQALLTSRDDITLTGPNLVCVHCGYTQEWKGIYGIRNGQDRDAIMKGFQKLRLALA